MGWWLLEVAPGANTFVFNSQISALHCVVQHNHLLELQRTSLPLLSNKDCFCKQVANNSFLFSYKGLIKSHIAKVVSF